MSLYYREQKDMLEHYSQYFRDHPESAEVVLTPIFGGFHIKRLDEDRCVHVHRMLVNWRLGEWYGACDSLQSSQTRYWCYQGLGREVFLKAVGEGILWEGGEVEPTGWVKNYRGEYGWQQD